MPVRRGEGTRIFPSLKPIENSVHAPLLSYPASTGVRDHTRSAPLLAHSTRASVHLLRYYAPLDGRWRSGPYVLTDTSKRTQMCELDAAIAGIK